MLEANLTNSNRNLQWHFHEVALHPLFHVNRCYGTASPKVTESRSFVSLLKVNYVLVICLYVLIRLFLFIYLFILNLKGVYFYFRTDQF